MSAGKSAGVEFRADLHMHTCCSVDSLAEPEAMISAAVKKGLSAIAITDHNEIAGALEVQKIAQQKKLPMQVIIGEEVLTDKGDLLVYFLKRKIEKGSLEYVLAEVKRQGAVCCAAHPYDFTRHGIPLDNLGSSALSKIDAIEAFNARITVPSHNAKALSFAQKQGKPIFAGSDAHHPSEVGAAYAAFSGVYRLDAKNILSAPRRAGGNLSPPHVHGFSRYAAIAKMIGWARHPKK